jgi:hypothetical protein
VRIDGVHVDSILQGETKDFVVPPGEHRVGLSMAWFWTSSEVAFQIGAGEHAELVCSPATSFVVGMLLIWVRPRGYIRLEGPDQSHPASVQET